MATANFANLAYFNINVAQNSANADFANYDPFGQSSGSCNFGGFTQQVTLLFSPKLQAEVPDQ